MYLQFSIPMKYHYIEMNPSFTCYSITYIWQRKVLLVVHISQIEHSQFQFEAECPCENLNSSTIAHDIIGSLITTADVSSGYGGHVPRRLSQCLLQNTDRRATNTLGQRELTFLHSNSRAEYSKRTFPTQARPIVIPLHSKIWRFT